MLQTTEPPGLVVGRSCGHGRSKLTPNEAGVTEVLDCAMGEIVLSPLYQPFSNARDIFLPSTLFINIDKNAHIAFKLTSVKKIILNSIL